MRLELKHMKALPTKLVISAAFASFLSQPVSASDIDLQRVEVVTHPSQGDIRPVAGATASIIRSEEGVFVDLATRGLEPGNAYTVWFVAINAPHNCTTSPCPGPDVLGASDIVQSDLGFLDGAIANPDG